MPTANTSSNSAPSTPAPEPPGQSAHVPTHVRCLPAEPDLVMLDLDGVVYRGAQAVPGAAEALCEYARDGLPYVFLTNNASRSTATVVKQLRGYGILVGPSQVLTAGVACARAMAGELPADSRIGVLGSPALLAAVKSAGLHAVPAGKLPAQYLPGDSASVPAAIVMGFNPGTRVGDVQRAIAAVRAGAQFWATNPDPEVPKETGTFPGNGTYTAIVADFTGQTPRIAGKPAPLMPRAVIEEFGAKNPVMVGDRCATDIAAGNAAGALTALVLTGIDDIHTALSAPPALRPDRIIADLTDLRRPMPAVRVTATSTSTDTDTDISVGCNARADCGTASAWLEGTRLHISGPPELGVHAALALAHAAGDVVLDPGNLPRRFTAEPA